jgi:hypothetical protein
MINPGVSYLAWRALGPQGEERVVLEKFIIAGDHYQFYLEDEELQADTSRLWDEQAVNDRIDVLPGLIAVGTGRYGGDIPVAVEVASSQPTDLLFDEWDHVVECSIMVHSGHLALSSPAGPGMGRFKVPPGTYRVWVFYGALDAVIDDFEGDDHYHIVLWPGTAIPPRVLKRKPRP